ncbi:hypothetical protein GLAREA_05615 [Glarea lozoyensis ATCC 20868]|uniref:Uncharacterized protein n=1 Tax=Glarea lozoyensis (strain ATCC 20868 / MF5171) TaxID=1116229 RepID=S3DD28_GLAL2|nr:uncharacterized protein GLAREA_05615 [Glarea lozoyensis ATCC 20868]EPE36277.1 hypothetical protein GLAREA_05615 [Glarea lozoyensis ATCC 20868]
MAHYGASIATQSAEEPHFDDSKDPARLAYRALINNTRTLEFTSFASNQRQQEGAFPEKGRAAALHFLNDGNVCITPFCSSSALQQYLDAEPNNSLPQGTISSGVYQPLRRMIILEDLPRNYVEILGSRLKIHPRFFAAHYSCPIKTGSAGKGLILGQPSRGYFVLQSPQMHYMTVKDQKLDGGGLLYRANSHVRRYILKGVKDNDTDLSGCFGEMWNVISFWSKEYRNGDWTAVVIVDPPLGDEIRHGDKREQRQINIAEGDPATGFGMQYPSLTANKDLSEDIDTWHIPKRSPSMRSIYEETLYAYSKGHHPVTDDPTSCTSIIRRLTLSFWIGYVDRMRYILNNHHKQVNGDEGSVLWQTWLFQDLVQLKADLEYVLIFLLRNLKVLEVRPGGGGRSSIVDDWETDEWNLVEARFTTVFLRLGFIASVFSIGGDYAVGEPKFWLFFAITTPIGILITFLLFTNIGPETKSKIGPKVKSLQETLRIRRSPAEGI